MLSTGWSRGGRRHAWVSRDIPAAGEGCAARTVDVVQNRSGRVLEAEAPADEAALMIDAPLGRIARVVEDFHLLSCKCGERRLHVAPPLKPDSVAQHLPWPCDLQEQHVKGFETLGHVRQEPVGLPSRQRRLAGAAMPPGGEIAAVIDAKAFGNAADRPVRTLLAPDCVTERQRRLEGVRGVEGQGHNRQWPGCDRR